MHFAGKGMGFSDSCARIAQKIPSLTLQHFIIPFSFYNYSIKILWFTINI